MNRDIENQTLLEARAIAAMRTPVHTVVSRLMDMIETRDDRISRLSAELEVLNRGVK